MTLGRKRITHIGIWIVRILKEWELKQISEEIRKFWARWEECWNLVNTALHKIWRFCILDIWRKEHNGELVELYTIWKSKRISQDMKSRFLNQMSSQYSCAHQKLARVTKRNSGKLQVFTNRCLYLPSTFYYHWYIMWIILVH